MEEVEWKTDILVLNYQTEFSKIALAYRIECPLQDQVPVCVAGNADICLLWNLLTCVVLNYVLS